MPKVTLHADEGTRRSPRLAERLKASKKAKSTVDESRWRPSGIRAGKKVQQ
jgi:hypothetical protein